MQNKKKPKNLIFIRIVFLILAIVIIYIFQRIMDFLNHHNHVILEQVSFALMWIILISMILVLLKLKFIIIDFQIIIIAIIMLMLLSALSILNYNDTADNFSSTLCVAGIIPILLALNVKNKKQELKDNVEILINVFGVVLTIVFFINKYGIINKIQKFLFDSNNTFSGYFVSYIFILIIILTFLTTLIFLASDKISKKTDEKIVNKKE